MEEKKISREEAVADVLHRTEVIDEAYLHLGAGNEAKAAELCRQTFPSFRTGPITSKMPAKALVTMAYFKLMERFNELDMPAKAQFCKDRTINNLIEFGPIK